MGGHVNTDGDWEDPAVVLSGGPDRVSEEEPPEGWVPPRFRGFMTTPPDDEEIE